MRDALADGAEAAIVGSLSHFRSGDAALATYRCHGYPLVLGSDSKAIDMAQSMCRKLGNGSKKGIETALYYIKDHTNLADDEITTFAGVAAQAYCADKLQKQSG